MKKIRILLEYIYPYWSTPDVCECQITVNLDLKKEDVESFLNKEITAEEFINLINKRV